ncbi:MAG: T9SS type A sorting domain-containing protein [Sphingobacteriaceae bacterium]|nr:T9SS type A sorting domain-containing protein [Sphingobacteriaceae bacterium]
MHRIFETGSFPNNEWITTPPQFGSGFAQTSTVGASGQKCLFVNNYGDNPNEGVELFSPKFDLTNVTGAQLSFKYAFSQKGNSNDELTVFISTNCGQSWTTIFGQIGSGLATTAAPTNTTAFIPLSSEFKTELINLGSYQGNSNVHIRFEFTPDAGGPGNNFYLDDINLTGTVGLKENVFYSNYLKLFPNPAKTQVSLFSSVAIKQIEMFDLIGKQVGSIEGSNTNEQLISVSQLAKGVYFVKVTSNSGSAFKKLVIE